MTLSRQFISILSLALLLGFGGAFLINVADTRAYLTKQLESHAQDTATSLGVSLTQQVASGDVIHMESVIDAVFDRGYYREIVVADVDDSPLVKRMLPVKVDRVPDWFIDRLPLDTPRAFANLTDGWRQAGRVYVTSHPGYAYDQLWAAAVKTFWWMLGLCVVTLACVGIAVRIILRPLAAIERQALAIGEREFTLLHARPRTRELGRVVEAMNAMARKVEQMLAKQQEQAERLRAEAYVDPVTGVGNRRAFERDLERLVARREEHAFGAVVELSITGLEEANKAGGRDAGDRLLNAAAEALSARFTPEGATVARVGGALFAVVVPDATRDQVERLAQRCVDDLAERGANLGVACYSGGELPRELVAQAEAALRNAEQSGLNGWHIYEPTETAGGPEVFEEERWRTILSRTIADGRIVLLAQEVRSADLTRRLHREVLARIEGEDGQLVTAGVFFPMAARLGMTAALDRLIVETLFAYVDSRPDGEEQFAVNLAPASVRDSRFGDWLIATLESRPAIAPRFSFELAAHVVLHSPSEASALGARLHAAGARIGVDHSGAGEVALPQGLRAKLDYLKIDGAFVTGIDQDRDRQTYLRSLVGVGHGLDLSVIAEYVETERELKTVAALGFDGVQGHFVGQPKSLDEDTR